MNKIVCISFFAQQLHPATVPGSRFRQWNPDWLSMGKIFTTAYQQTAAEYRALCYQAFNLARYRVDMYKPGNGLPPAIITQTWMKPCWITALYAVNRAR